MPRHSRSAPGGPRGLTISAGKFPSAGNFRAEGSVTEHPRPTGVHRRGLLGARFVLRSGRAGVEAIRPPLIGQKARCLPNLARSYDVGKSTISRLVQAIHKDYSDV